MAARAERLGDDPATWEDELRDLEVLLVVHAQSADALEAEAGRWERALRAPDSGLELAHVQPAGLLGEQREHFGFTDGFSQPAIEGVAREDVRGQGIPYKRAPWWPLSRTQWRAIKPGEFVLGYEDEDRGPAARAARALRPQRELHGVAQAAPGRRRLPRPARRAGPAPASSTRSSSRPRWSGAGATAARSSLRPDGPDPELGNDKQRANDFRYGDDAARPALPARRPRAAHEPPRRAGLGGPADRAPPDPAPGHALRAGPARRRRRTTARPRGLLFVCLQASIARQFEIVQSQWCNDGNAFGLGREADPITRPRRAARCATSSRATRRAWPRPCAATSSAAAASTSSCRRSARCGRCPRSVGRRSQTARRARNPRRNGLEHRSTPSHAPGSDQPWSQSHDESRTCTPLDADPPHQRGDGPPQGRGRPDAAT